jgi:glycosyltransferase involved in cell wall biosynthesis
MIMGNKALPNKMVSITAIILTYNEEKNIEACLKSIVDWCPEIFIVDSGSTDGTKEICQKYPTHIVEHHFVDHPDQWHWALNNLPVAGEWVMPLDADYIVSPELGEELRQAVLKHEPGVNGYYARHQYYFRGVPMRGFKSHTLCLLRPRQTRVDYGELVDHRFLVAGQTRVLSGLLSEINNNEWDIDVWTDKHQNYSTRMAIQEVLSHAGVITRSLSPNLLGNPDEKIIWAKRVWERLPLNLRPFLYFFYRYFLRFGFLDGKVGMTYHFLHAFWFRLMIDLKISEIRRQLTNGELTLEELEKMFLGNRAHNK